MFLKYISNNFKKHKLKYIVMALCEIVLLLISLFACCSVMNYVTEQEGAQYDAKDFEFCFPNIDGMNLVTEKDKIEEEISKCPNAVDIRDRLYEFCRQIPVEIEVLDVGISKCKYDYIPRVLYFQDYEDLVYFFTKKYKKYWTLSRDVLPTEEQYLNHEKVAIIGTFAGNPYVYSDSDHIVFGQDDEEYLVLGENPVLNYFDIFLGSEPDNAKVTSVRFDVKEFITDEQRAEIENLFREIVAPDINIANTYLPDKDGLLEIRKSISILIMTLALIIISTFNILAIFKHMTDEHRNEYAVLRLCGYGRFKALTLPLAEILSLSGICAVLSCGIFAVFIPLLKTIFPVVSVLFDFGFFAAFTIGFIAITAIMFAVYIAPSLNRSVSDELREM